MARLSPESLDLLIETLACAFWYKRPLLDLLRRCGIPQSELDLAEQEGAKYKIARYIVSKYEQSDRGHEILRQVAVAISNKATHSDLTPEQAEASRKRQAILANLLKGDHRTEARHDRDAIQLREVDRLAGERTGKLAELQQELNDLFPSMGAAGTGEQFEKIITRIALAYGLEARGRYTANGREFDGSICIDSDVYLVEARFRSEKGDAADISNFRDKVQGNADGALGLFVSMAGFTTNAVDNASRAGTPLVLLDSQHVMIALSGTMGFGDIVRRARKHAMETGQSYWLPGPKG